MRKTSFTLIAIAMITGCSSVDSNNIDTAGLYADFQAVASGDNNTEVTAWIKQEPASLTFVALTGGDKLTAYMMETFATTETAKNMQEGTLGGATWYSAIFSQQAEDTQFRIGLDRAGTGKVSAPDNATTLPAPFTLDTLVGTAQTVSNSTTSFSRGDTVPIYVRWNPADFVLGDVLTYGVAGGCIHAESGTIDWYTTATNSLQLAQSWLVSTDPVGNPNCAVTVTMTLTREGTVDSAFGQGGQFRGVQKREKTYTTTP
jgi:hypothetical protein